mgnify:CR=1 FL=1
MRRYDALISHWLSRRLRVLGQGEGLVRSTDVLLPSLSLPSGVTVNVGGTVATGNGWTLTMTPGSGGAAPTFVCS